MTSSDRALFWAVSILAVLGLLYGSAASASSEEDRKAKRRQFKRENRNLSGRADTPVVNLPPGVSVDPNTGLMVGFGLQVAEGTTGVPWETLRAYDYEPGIPGMPEDIKQLDGKKVAMLGFLWAIYDYDDIHKFGLVGSHWSCCYGIPPGLSDVVIVNLEDGHEGLSQTFNPVRVTGTFHVREMKEGGFTVAIYEITDAKAVVLEY